MPPRASALVAALAVACATTSPVDAAAGRPLGDANPDRPLSDGPGGPRTAAPEPAADLLDLALLASGYDDPLERAAAREEVEGRLTPILDQIRAQQDGSARGGALLVALHADWFRHYDARATTLRELLADGRFNCLSSAVLFNIAAERVGLQASGELLPTHARSIVVVPGGRSAVVEVTSAQGYDPDAKTQRAILEQVATPAEPGQRAIVATSGARVSSEVLAGTIYVNRASLAQERGDLAEAERLFARAERLAGTAETRVVLRDQRAALMTQLAATDLVSEDPARVPRAYATMLAVLRLGSEEPVVRATAEHNTRAAAERLIASHADHGREDRVLRVLEDISKVPMSAAVRAAVSAFAWSEIGRLRAQRGDFEGTLAAIDRGLEAEVSARDAHLASVLRDNRYATLRRMALSSAKTGELERSLEIVRRLEALPGLTPTQKEEAGRDRARVLQIAADARFAAGDVRGAVALYRQAAAHTPQDTTIRHNLVAGLQQLAVEAVNAGRCADVRSELDEIRALASDSAFLVSADVRCMLLDASARLEAGDVDKALELLRGAYALRPSDATVRLNLGIGLVAWVRARVGAQDCTAARAALKEAEGLAPREAAAIRPAFTRACRR